MDPRFALTLKLVSSVQQMIIHFLNKNNFNRNPILNAMYICIKKFKHASQLSIHKKLHKNKSSLTWPKLTDLLKKEIEDEVLLSEAEELVTLPLISMPQAFTLPKFIY